MKISIIHPSYGRPELAFETFKKWLHSGTDSCFNKSSDDAEYILCLSRKDKSLNEYKEKFQTNYVKIIYCEDANMVIQMNLAAKQATGDLIIAISDDFDCPQNWDLKLSEHLKNKKDFVVRINDGISSGIISLPIMDRTFYNRLGYIYHPDYNHFYGDEELYRVGLMTGKKIELPIIFEHRHHVAGKAKKDHVNIKNSKFYASDKATFKKREAKGFDLVMLSLLIPSLKNRVHKLNTLLNSLQSQIEKLKAENAVQLIKFTDSGERTIGEKRNYLVHYAKGDYIAFIDDDDMVPANYVQLLLCAIQDKPDCCSLNGILKQAGRPDRVFKHSISYNGWYEKDNILYRSPNHLNCIKKEIALQILYPETNRGEDKAYSEQMQNSGLLKTEAVISETLYFYNYTRK